MTARSGLDAVQHRTCKVRPGEAGVPAHGDHRGLTRWPVAFEPAGEPKPQLERLLTAEGDRLPLLPLLRPAPNIEVVLQATKAILPVVRILRR
jgi:hypothetical protein